MEHHRRACCPSPAQAGRLGGVSPLVEGASVCHCKVDSLEEESSNSVININAQKMVAAKARRGEGAVCRLVKYVLPWHIG